MLLTISGASVAVIGAGLFYHTFAVRNTRDAIASRRFRRSGTLVLLGALLFLIGRVL